MNRLLILFGLLITLSSSGQYLVRGIVYDNEGNPMPGVNVVNKTDGTTVTDASGKFTLNCPYLNQEIVISFVGFKSQQIIGDTTKVIEVILEPDVMVLGGDPFVCIFYNRHSKIGLSSGIYYTPIGFRIENFTPDIFKIWPMLTTGIEWRTNNSDNRYIDLFFRRYEILRLGNSYLSLFGEFKKLKVDTDEIKEYNISPDIKFKRLRLSIGYTFQNIVDNEINKSGHGINLNIYAYLFGQVGVDLKTKYVLDSYQFDYKLFWDLAKPKLTIGLGYEKMGPLSELTTSLQYRLSY